MYDVTNRASFEALNGWLKEMRTHLEKSSDMDKVVFVVCANKVSFERLLLCLTEGQINSKLKCVSQTLTRWHTL